PTCNHSPGNLGSLFNVVFGTGCFGSKNNLLGCSSAKYPDDACAEISLRVVISIRLGTLVRDAECLPTRNDGYAINRVCTRNNQSEDRVSAFVIGNSLTFFRAENE